MKDRESLRGRVFKVPSGTSQPLECVFKQIQRLRSSRESLRVGKDQDRLDEELCVLKEIDSK